VGVSENKLLNKKNMHPCLAIRMTEEGRAGFFTVEVAGFELDRPSR